MPEHVRFIAKLQTVGNQTIKATDTVTASITGTSNTIAVAPNALLGQVATTDADFKNTDGFDVLFTKGGSGSNLKLKNTNPGTFHYLLTLTNETGATIHDNTVLNAANGATDVRSSSRCPALPTSVGYDLVPTSAFPSSRNVSTSAFTAQGQASSTPIRTTRPMRCRLGFARPRALLAGTARRRTYTNGQPPDGTIVKCIKITGFSIPKHHKCQDRRQLRVRA